MVYIGPTQPFVGGGGVQENFRQMVDHVISYNPDCPPQLVKRRLNTRLRMIQDRRMWGGLLVRGELSVPAAYSIGSVSVTRGSNVVTSTLSSWPYNDLVGTTLAQPVLQPGEYQDVYPSSMARIEAGDWLMFDSAPGGGGPNKEAILVISIGPTSFKAKPAVGHNMGEHIYKSSLTRRQFRLGTTRPFYNIRGVTGDLELILDLPWGHTSSVGSTYKICQAYVNLGQNLRMVWSMVNNAQGWKVRLNMPQEVLDSYDGWRSGQGWCYMLSDYIPDEIGRFQYELYPTPSFEQGIPYLAYRTVENMVEDEDTPPPAIPSHILVHGALADVMMLNRKSPYYDQVLAQAFANQFEVDLVNAVMADDSIFMNNLQWAFNQYPFQNSNFGGAAWRQSHDW